MEILNIPIENTSIIQGDTDFTLIGADSNTVGEWFVATGVGGGTTGTAYKESIEIL